jgi:hypothetical protein
MICILYYGALHFNIEYKLFYRAFVFTLDN